MLNFFYYLFFITFYIFTSGNKNTTICSSKSEESEILDVCEVKVRQKMLAFGIPLRQTFLELSYQSL